MNFFGELFYPTQTFGRRYAHHPYYPVQHQPRGYRVADLSDLFDDEEELYVPLPKMKALSVPTVHLNEHKEGWVASVDLPGVRSFKNIFLDLDGSVLHIRAESFRGYYRQVYTHTLALPEGADLSELRASFKNETLTIVIPRQVQEEIKNKKEKKSIKNKEEEAHASEKTESTTLVEEKPRETPQSSEVQKEKPQPQQQVTRRSPFFFSMPRVSQSQTETHQVLSIEFPEGWDVKDNIDVEVCNGVLNISVVKKDKGSSFVFKRSVGLPSGVTESNVTAKFNNSTLEVSYPKPKPPKAFKIQVSDSSSTPSKAEESQAVVISSNTSEQQQSTCEESTVTESQSAETSTTSSEKATIEEATVESA